MNLQIINKQLNAGGTSADVRNWIKQNRNTYGIKKEVFRKRSRSFKTAS
jgi:hypothetical protein